MLQGNRQKLPEILYLDIWWAILAGDLVQNAPIRFLLLFGHFPKCICFCVSAAEKVSNTLWAFPNESPKPLRYYPNDLQELLDTVPNMSWHKFRNFFYISLKVACFLFIKIKIEDTTEKFKNYPQYF